jgi:hypothetical protein
MTTDLESLFAASADSNADDEHDLEGQTIACAWSHGWRYTRTGDRYVRVTIDLTPIRSGTGPSRLLDIVEGRSKQAFSA